MAQLPDDLMRELLATFNSEATERLEAANRHMLALEEATDPDVVSGLVVEIFREVHSLKGASGAVGLTDVQGLSHRLETLFERARRGEVIPTDQFDLVYQTLDAISTLVNAAATGTDAGVNASDLIARLDAVEQAKPPKKPAAKKPETNGTGENGDQKKAAAPPPKKTAPPPPPKDTNQAGPAPASPQARPPAPAKEVGGGSAGAPATEASARADETIRVSIAKLDSLMAQVGELLVATIGAEQRLTEIGELSEAYAESERAWRDARPKYRKLLSDAASSNGNGTVHVARSELQSLLNFVHDSDSREQAAVRQLRELRRKLGVDGRRLTQVVTDLQEEVRRTRMLHVGTIFTALPRVVRDVARSCGKDAVLRIEGDETEVDRAVLEQLKDPLFHLLRNSVDHGLETPSEREASHKIRRGTILVWARQVGNSLCIEVADDGAGIDIAKVKSTAVKKKLITAEAAEAMDDDEALDLIFRSGLSTSPIITDVSGRGVGLDVVRENVERMHGLISVESTPGEGTKFKLTVPLSVATTQCLIVKVGGMKFALPVTNIARIARLTPADVGKAEGKEAIHIDGRPIPLLRLADLLGVPSALKDDDEDTRLPVVISGSAEKRMAFLVDELAETQEVVVKNLPKPLYRVRHAAGATMMGSGEVVLILNAGDLSRSAEHGVSRRANASVVESEAEQMRPKVLVADDSIVTRTLEKNILEAAGYDVRVASDGVEAWELLQGEGADLLVSDVEMPRLDGFDLTARIRADEKFGQLPVVLVTSLDSREDRERGIEVGADAHIVKQAFSQDGLLETIRTLI